MSMTAGGVCPCVSAVRQGEAWKVRRRQCQAGGAARVKGVRCVWETRGMPAWRGCVIDFGLWTNGEPSGRCILSGDDRVGIAFCRDYCGNCVEKGLGEGQWE